MTWKIKSTVLCTNSVCSSLNSSFLLLLLHSLALSLFLNPFDIEEEMGSIKGKSNLAIRTFNSIHWLHSGMSITLANPKSPTGASNFLLRCILLEFPSWLKKKNPIFSSYLFDINNYIFEKLVFLNFVESLNDLKWKGCLFREKRYFWN